MVAGYLRLVRPLGRGGMGAVWVAEHLRLGGHVAVKFLSGEFLGDPGTLARFEQEARVSAQVRSPHVVQVMDFGVTEGEPRQPFIVMELLDGEDLSKLLEREGPLPPAKAELLLGQLCQALGYAHSMGIVHRDIKPENVFLVRGARPFVKLLDFGIAIGNNANTIQRLTQTGLIIGTAHYMSPEQLFTAREVDHRTDLWALGILAYQILTTRLPFNGDTFGALCLQVQAGQFVPPTELAAVPKELNTWFRKALATDREKRFQSAEELSVAFQAAVAGIGAAAQMPPALAQGVHGPSGLNGDPAMRGNPQSAPDWAPRTGTAVSVTAGNGTAGNARPPRPVWPFALAGVLGLGVLGTVAAIVFGLGPRFSAPSRESEVVPAHLAAAEALLNANTPSNPGAAAPESSAKAPPQAPASAAQPPASAAPPAASTPPQAASGPKPQKPAPTTPKPSSPKVARPSPTPAAPPAPRPAKPAPDKPKDRGF
jgi:serine/threonine-protein kinase